MTNIAATADYDPVRGESEPGRYWSTTNTAEATPQILTPLCWSVWGDGLEAAWLRSMGDFGVLSRREQIMSRDMNRRSTAAIYGRQAVNVDVLRAVLARLPGVAPDDVERDLLGSVRPGLPPEPRAVQRIPIIAAKLPMSALRLDSRHAALCESQYRWWKEEVFDVYPANTHARTEALHRLHVAAQRFSDAMYIHSIVRFLLPAAEGAVLSAAEKAGCQHIVSDTLRGYGSIAETQMTEALWEVAQGRRTLVDFLADYGFHGPSEGNVYTLSWREEPGPLHSLVASFRARDDIISAKDREEEAMRARVRAEHELLCQVPRLRRPALRFMLRRAAGLTRKLELTKAAYLMALDGCRAAARELGSQYMSEGRIQEADDIFFLTIPEIDAMAADRSSRAEACIAYRRSQREIYEKIVIPTAFTGMPDMTTEDPAVFACPPPDRPLSGKASGGGRREGRARVLTQPDTDIELEAGDILVCRFTDPSWAPLMMLASALVIDIGSQSSHGAVVARELGIPYVIGTEIGTRVIHDGDRVVVDGAANSVAIVRD